MTYFLDTNIWICILNGSLKRVIEKFEEIDLDDIAIPSIVAAELFYGAHKSAKREYNLSRFRTFLSQLKVISLDAAVVEMHGEIRCELEQKGIPIGSNDYFIAAIAKANNGILVTNNIREFSRIDGLMLEDWMN